MRGFVRVRRVVEHTDLERALARIERRVERVRREVQHLAAIAQARGDIAADRGPVRRVKALDARGAITGGEVDVAGHRRAVAALRNHLREVGGAVEIDPHPRERARVEVDTGRVAELRGDLVRAVIPRRLRLQDVERDAEVDAGRQRPRCVLAGQHESGHRPIGALRRSSSRNAETFAHGLRRSSRRTSDSTDSRTRDPRHSDGSSP
jgi:hypothetical protein